MTSSKGKLLFLFSMLILEVALIFLLKKFGLLGIGTGIQFVVSLLFVLFPLVVAGVVLLRNRLRFSLWAMMIGTAMIAIFLSLSMIPLFRYRTARQGSAKLLAAKGHVVEGLKNFRWYETYKLDPLPEKQPAPPDTLPLWLASFSSGMKDVPRDADVSQILFMNDEQCKIFAENWKRFTNLRMLGINRGVSSEGFKLLQDIIPKLESLDVVYTQDVNVPRSWYLSLTNIRILMLRDSTPGTPIYQDHLDDIVSLENIQMLTVVGFAFDDKDASKLASSKSIKRVGLHGTAVTAAGEAKLASEDRIVFRD